MQDLASTATQYRLDITLSAATAAHLVLPADLRFFSFARFDEHCRRLISPSEYIEAARERGRRGRAPSTPDITPASFIGFRATFQILSIDFGPSFDAESDTRHLAAEISLARDGRLVEHTPIICDRRRK